MDFIDRFLLSLILLVDYILFILILQREQLNVEPYF